MKSSATAEFWKAYAELSPELQEQARKAYQLWQENLFHPLIIERRVEHFKPSVDAGGMAANTVLSSTFCFSKR